MAVNIDTGSMLKHMRGAGCRDTTICKCMGYVGLARTAPPNNTNFQLTFLPTQLQEALYKTYSASSFESK